jgi:rhodanese-related sulfurtransferase
MTAAFAPHLAVVSPQEAWEALHASDDAILVDVRTRAEWTFVGAPDLSGARGAQAFVEWTQFPGGAPNPGFVEQVAKAVGDSGAARAFFICRSGARSAAAAAAMQDHFAAGSRRVVCANVAEGFEGDPDSRGRRGAVNGWKARGLPWRQS